MEDKQAFRILQISETKEESQITNAYRSILKQTHPEENPQGFQELRLAYETALAYARTTQQQEEPKTEVDVWIDKVENVYDDMYLRRDVTVWNQLFSDPVCEDLDSFCEAREKLLAFCMNHAFLPQVIWQRANEVFQILESMSELSEIFPSGYLNYVEQHIEEGGFFTYEDFSYLVERKDTAFDADQYVSNYFRLRDMVETWEEEQCTALMEDMRNSGMYHPYFDVECLRFWQRKGEKEKAYRLAEQLLEKHNHLFYVKFYAGEAFFHAGEIERAGEQWRDILAKEPDHSSARVNMARYYMEKKEYQKALDMLSPLAPYNRDNEFFQNLYEQINEKLAEVLEHQYETDKEEEICVALADCYRRLKKNQQALQVLKDREDVENSYHYMYVYGHVLLALEKFQEAKAILGECLAMQLDLEETQGKSEQILVQLSKLYQALYRCALGLEAYEEAVDICQKAALKMEEYQCRREWLAFQDDLASVYLKRKEYEHTVDVCDRIVAVDESYYPAYIHRQQAFYMLTKAQEVVDDFYHIIEYCDGFALSYQLAAEIFLYYNQPLEAKGILERARENQVEFSPFMRLLEIQIARACLETDEELCQIRQKLHELIAEQEAEGFPDEECSEDKLYYEAGQIEKAAENYEKAIPYFEKVLALNPTQHYAQCSKGWCLYNLEKYQEALLCYEAVEKECGEVGSYQYEKGLCLEGLEQTTQSIACLEKAVELEGNIGDACEKLADYYFEYYKDHYHREDFQKAVDYITMEIEDGNGAYYYILRGNYYLQAGDSQAAIEDFRMVIKEYPNNWYALESLGRAYQEMDEFDTAVSYFESSIEQMEKDEKMTGRVYRRLAKCLKIMRRYQEAVKVCQRGIAMDQETAEFTYDMLGDLYKDMGQYPQAMEAYKQSGEDQDFYTNLGDVAEAMGDLEAGIAYYEQARGFYERPWEAYQELGQFYIFHVKDYERAIPYLEQSIALSEELDGQSSDMLDIAICYYMMGNKEKAVEVAVKAAKLQESYLAKIGCTKEEYLSYPPRKPVRALEEAWWRLFQGQAEQAKQMFEEIGKMHKCEGCGYPGCYEAKLYLARIYETEGSYEKALLLYEETHKLAPSNMESLKGACAMREKLQV